MSTTISDTLPFAFAIAISPLPIIAVILILLSRRPRSNGLAFILGWILGLAIAEVIVLALVDLVNLTPGGDMKPIFASLRLVIGASLIVLGIRQWRHRPGPGEQSKMPGWMQSIDDYTPRRTMALAALLSSAGNVALILAAAAAIARAKLDIGQEAAAIGVFVAIGSLTVAAVLIYHLVVGDSASKMLNRWRDWLLKNNATIMSIVLVIAGIVLASKGIGGLNLGG